MVITKFQITLSLGAIKNIFINSLAKPAFWRLLRYEIGLLGLQYFLLLRARRRGKKSSHSRLRDLRKEFTTRALRNSIDHMTKSEDDCFSFQKIQVVKAA